MCRDEQPLADRSAQGLSLRFNGVAASNLPSPGIAGAVGFVEGRLLEHEAIGGTVDSVPDRWVLARAQLVEDGEPVAVRNVSWFAIHRRRNFSLEHRDHRFRQVGE